MISEDFTSLEEQVEIAWNGWKLEQSVEPDIPFAHALGYAIMEAYLQYENWKTACTNDNTEEN